jgi:hypothetical protein
VFDEELSQYDTFSKFLALEEETIDIQKKQQVKIFDSDTASS